jgi:opacity protein-like surface antigen
MDLKKNICKLIYIIFTTIFAINCQQAYAQACDCLTPKDSWFIGIGSGAAWMKFPHRTKVANSTPIVPPWVDTFSIKRPSAQAIVSLLAGYRWSRAQEFFPYYSLAFNYKHQFSTRVSGTIGQFRSSEFESYHYKLHVFSDIFTLNGKLNLYQWKVILPYVSAGLGASLNHTGRYLETVLPFVHPSRMSTNYERKDRTRFTYLFGAGFDVILNKIFWADIGYEFANLGQFKTGRGSDTWHSAHINFRRAWNHTVLASITYQY